MSGHATIDLESLTLNLGCLTYCMYMIIQFLCFVQCKTLSGSSVETLVLTSHNYQYCGSTKGTKFLQDKIALVDGVDLKGVYMKNDYFNSMNAPQPPQYAN